MISSFDKGILYVATGRRYFAEVVQSAQSARRHLPDIPILLYTDEPEAFGAPFDEVRRIESPRHFFVDKVGPLTESPFEKTLFLDTDTFVCADIADLFDLLDRFDVALAHAPLRHDRPYATPNCFVEMNSGVLLFRRHPRVQDLFRRWLAIYNEELKSGPQPEIGDQVHLRRAVYESEVTLYILPPEYNFRSVILGATGRQSVKIIHGRDPDMPGLARLLNRHCSVRAVVPSVDQLDRLIFLDEPGQLLVRFLSPLVRFASRMRQFLRR